MQDPNHVLISYAYFGDLPDETLQAMFERPGFLWLLDSGGFTALNAGWTIKLDDYMAFLHKWGSYLHGYMALDVVGNPEATAENLRVMLSEGLKPVPIHVWGDDEQRLDELFEFSEYVALAGLRRPHRLHSPKSYVALKHSWSRGRRVHWLGYTNHDMLCRFRPYSCDSSNAVSGYRYGLLTVYTGGGVFDTERPSGKVFKRIPLTLSQRRALATMGVTSADLEKQSNRYGSSHHRLPDEFRKLSGGKDEPKDENIMGRVTLRSNIRYSRFMFSRYGVRVFNAMCHTKIGRYLFEAEEEVRSPFE